MASRPNHQIYRRHRREAKARAPLSKSHRGSLPGVAARLPDLWFRLRGTLFGLLYEVRNIPRRMAARCKEGAGVVPAGPLLWRPDNKGPLTQCMKTQAHIRDMQKLFRDHPFLTAVDLPVGLAAWEMGFQFGVRQSQAQCCDTSSASAE